MLVGYVRVSTIEQSEERQIVELREKAGVETFSKKLTKPVNGTVKTNAVVID